MKRGLQKNLSWLLSLVLVFSMLIVPTDTVVASETTLPILELSATDTGITAIFNTTTSGMYYTVYCSKVEEVTEEALQLSVEADQKQVSFDNLQADTVYYVTAYGKNDMGYEETLHANVKTLAPQKGLMSLSDDFSFTAFGANADGTVGTENTIAYTENGVIITSSAGKISGTEDGLALYGTKLTNDEDFVMTATAKVNSFDTNNQVGFGIMARDVLEKKSNMLSVGAVKQSMSAFSRQGEGASFVGDYAYTSDKPAAGNTYSLTLKKSGNLYELICNGESYIATYEDLFTEDMYVGLFVSRKAEVEFTNIEFSKSKVSDLSLISKPSKTTYLENQSLELAGLVVTADGQEVPHEKLIVTGFNNTEVGEAIVNLNYGGKSVSFPVAIEELTCTALDIIYTPAKTTYYLGDEFDLAGLELRATFNSGEARLLGAGEYSLKSELDLNTPGTKKVTLIYNGKANEKVETSFEINVLPDELTSIHIAKMPIKTVYYIGEALDLDGMAIKATYGTTQVLLEADEYTIDSQDFDTAQAGTTNISITHKNKTILLEFVVKEPVATSLAISKFPKTTYYIGEAFENTGLEIVKVYDSGIKEIMTANEYIVDSTAFNGEVAGTYTIKVTPNAEGLKAISYNVSVREEKTYEWKSISFGQSISLDKNYVEVEKPGTAEGTIRVVAEEGGGKVTNSFQDGITFYYTEIDNATENFELSADIKVNAFAKLPSPDNQEGFGIMARDAMGTHGDASVFYSNMAAVGGYRGVTQMVMRSGVTASDASGAGTGLHEETILENVRPSLENTSGDHTYRLTLKKTNSGYIGQLNDGEEVLYYEPDALGVQDGKVYVGFYAARLADIEVSNVSFSVTDARTDEPKVEKPQLPVTPKLTLAGLTESAVTDYHFTVYSNVSGTATIKQGETIVARDMELKAGQTYVQEAVLDENATTAFTVSFVPSTDQDLTSYSKIIRKLSVTMKSYGLEGGEIYASTNGSASGDGSFSNPLDLQTAINYVRAGQTICVLEGTYNLTKAIGVVPGNNGTADAYKALKAYPGAKVTFDAGKKVAGFTLDGDYWHIYGIDFTGAVSTGVRIGGNHNIVELCNTYDNGDTGLQISRYTNSNGGVSNNIADWPSYNLILNCTSYDNRDASENNADGFAAKLTCGIGNIFRGCISHNNIDDAWDLFAKGSTGAIGAVTIEDCIAYGNGTLTNGHVGAGDKNGFKLGGEGIAVPHVIRNSISFNNGATGFSSNSNPAVISENCISYDNGDSNFDWRVYTNVTPQFKATGNISYRSTKGKKDLYPEYLLTEDNFYYNGTQSANSKGVTLTDANFKSLEVPAVYIRDEEGNIIFGDFLGFIAPDDESEDNNNPGDNEENDKPGSDNEENDKPDSDDEEPTTPGNGSTSNSGSGSGASSLNTVDEMILSAINQKEEVTVEVNKNNQLIIGVDTLDKLVEAKKALNVQVGNIVLTFKAEALQNKCIKDLLEGDKAFEMKVAPAAGSIQAVIEKMITADDNLSTVAGMAQITELSISNVKADESFAEPLAINFKLEKVGNPAALTLVKYEKQADGTYTAIKLGGTYDKESKIFTALITGTGYYGVAEAKDLVKVNLQIGKTAVVVNDQTKVNDTAPILVEGVTMVPLRFVAENLNADVKWNNKAKKVLLTVEENVIELSVGEGSQEILLQEGRTLVPLRYISEQLNAKVLWVPSTKEVQIVK